MSSKSSFIPDEYALLMLTWSSHLMKSRQSAPIHSYLILKLTGQTAQRQQHIIQLSKKPPLLFRIMARIPIEEVQPGDPQRSRLRFVCGRASSGVFVFIVSQPRRGIRRVFTRDLVPANPVFHRTARHCAGYLSPRDSNP